MEDGVQFLGKYRKWIAIKKMEVTSDTQPDDVALFLASLTETVERKAEDFLKQVLDLTEVDAQIDEIVGFTQEKKKKKYTKAKSEDDFARILKAVNSAKVNKPITIAVEKLGLNEKIKSEKTKFKAFKTFGKVYALRSALLKAGLEMDYSTVSKLARKT